MKRLTSVLVVITLLLANATASGQQLDVAPRSGAYWFAYAGKLPIGSTVRVRTTDGQRLTAVLAVVDEAGVTLELKTRIPEPPRRIQFDRLAQLELKQNGTSLAKGIAIGAGIGAATVFGILVMIIASFD